MLLLLICVAIFPAVSASIPSASVHAFFYSWYGNPETDSKWMHWNHTLLEHWTPSIAMNYPKGQHHPPEDIGAAFYPQRGPYSSKDVDVLEAQFLEMQEANIGVAVVSYWKYPDGQGVETASAIPLILEAAKKTKVKIAFHLEPYDGRTVASIRKDIVEIIDNYGQHEALYRDPKHPNRPWFYVYDSYLIPPEQWNTLLNAAGSISIRNTQYDGTFIALLLNAGDEPKILKSHFDGIYTYFGSTGFSYGSTIDNWIRIANWARGHSLIFIPCVAPGYDDTAIRPWNGQVTRLRLEGQYYDNTWQAAIASAPDVVGITSYNEWGEGTQIEPAAMQSSYLKYPQSPTFYLDLTKKWVNKLEEHKEDIRKKKAVHQSL